MTQRKQVQINGKGREEGKDHKNENNSCGIAADGEAYYFFLLLMMLTFFFLMLLFLMLALRCS